MSTALLVMWLWAAQTVNGHPIPEGCHLEHIVTAEGTAINTQLCGEDNPERHKVEPQDVPAVQEPVESKCWGSSNGMSELAWECSDNAHPPKDAGIPSMLTYGGAPATIAGEGGWRWTCADKSRILLTSEDGTKHCIKFAGR